MKQCSCNSLTFYRELPKCPPFFLTQAHSLFLVTLKENVSLTLFVETTILLRKHSSVFTTVTYTWLFMKHHTKKSIGLRSGNNGDQAITLPIPIRKPITNINGEMWKCTILLNMRSILLSPPTLSSSWGNLCWINKILIVV